jgi:alkanesulfonate monooxygenase SsuD/methylene tetrahydromethanopterin reductase-like flavin-dependent oxidoreductase (luciferase family)
LSIELYETIQQAIDADNDGFDSVWFPQNPSYGFDALTIISLAGGKTNRIELGTAVLPTYPIHPLTMAKQALTAQAACGGRLTLGMGLSHKPTIEDVMGLSYDSPAQHMQEYLSVVGSLISERQVDFVGQVFQVKAELNVVGR